MMRIISGSSKGTKLYTLEGDNTRPTLDRVKESLFNIIQGDIAGCNFLDLFSGSGSIGLEAASRGAKKVVLCDNERAAINVIKRNIDKTHLQNKVKLYYMDFRKLLSEELKDKQDIIYLDPPYDTDYAIEAVKLILENELIHKGSIIIIETDNKNKIIEKISELSVEIIDERKYGRANLIFLYRCEET